MYERWLLGIAPAIAVPSGRARANGTRASAHVTFQRTTSERKLCFSAKLRRQQCCLAERCLQGILPACRPIHCPRPGARASKKKDESERAHQVAFLYETGRLPSSYVGNWCRLPRLSRKQRGSVFARLRSHRQRLRPVIHTLCSRGDNQETVQPRNSARYRRKEPERRPASFPRTEKKPRVWALGSHVTDNFTLRTMGGVHTCRLLRNVQQICCSAQTRQHSRLQRSCCPVWALQHIYSAVSLHIIHSVYNVCYFSGRGECVCDSSEGCECKCDCGTAPLSGEEYSGPDCGCDPDYCYSQEYPEVSREGGKEGG